MFRDDDMNFEQESEINVNKADFGEITMKKQQSSNTGSSDTGIPSHRSQFMLSLMKEFSLTDEDDAHIINQSIQNKGKNANRISVQKLTSRNSRFQRRNIIKIMKPENDNGMGGKQDNDQMP